MGFCRFGKYTHSFENVKDVSRNVSKQLIKTVINNFQQYFCPGMQLKVAFIRFFVESTCKCDSMANGCVCFPSASEDSVGAG